MFGGLGGAWGARPWRVVPDETSCPDRAVQVPGYPRQERLGLRSAARCPPGLFLQPMMVGPARAKARAGPCREESVDDRTAIEMIHTTFFRRLRARSERLQRSRAHRDGPASACRREDPAPAHREGHASGRRGGPASAHRTRLAAETGDTLIEVLISALLIALVVVATTTGLNSTNRATALDRARSQADGLAQQAEDELRSEPVEKLSELNRTQVVEEGKTKYTITSTSTYIADASATSSCNSSTPHADYLQTTSTVSWPSMGATKPVEESSIISPPPGAALIVQVTEDGNALEGARVSATGPSPAATEHTLDTSSDGCAILALVPGDYEINVNKAGYVDPNWYANTREDPTTTHSAYLAPFLVAETTTKEAYDLGRAGTLEVSFLTGSTPAEGDAFVAFNTFMSAFKQVGTVGTYKSTVTSGKEVYPYPKESPYTVYAGTCEADSPSRFGVHPAEIVVPPGAIGAVTVALPPVNIRVMSGTGEGASTEGGPLNGATIYTDDTGCATARSFTTTSSGALPRPGLPFGKYSMCVGSAGRKWEGTFENNTAAGPSSTNWTNGGVSAGNAVIYLGTSPSGNPSGTSAGFCP
jgi:Tfp pilus assembly protein PilV